jgi:hypothetical protein
MSATKPCDPSCAVAYPENATAQLSLKPLARQARSKRCVVADATNAAGQFTHVAGIAQVARVAPVAGRIRFQLDTINPMAGVGGCASEHGSCYPTHFHSRYNFQSSETSLSRALSIVQFVNNEITLEVSLTLSEDHETAGGRRVQSNH